LELGRIPVNVGVDLDPLCRFPYEQNNSGRFEERNITSVTGDEVAGWYAPNDIRLLAGCAPCQPFSTYSQKYSYHTEKWTLLDAFSQLVRELQPELVTMENVVAVQKRPVFKRFLSALKSMEYHYSIEEVFCPEYGVPQNRTSLVLLASKFGPISLIKPTHSNADFKNVKMAIGHLDKIKAGQRSETDPLHWSSSLSKINMERIRCSKPGGTWRDWELSLRAKCHRQKSGKTYPSVYGRMSWDEPSPTITTQAYGFGNGRFGHPEQNRALSLREAALLQTFPESYQFA
ncbi:MAG: DNA cytosine methyltransferase, partial [Acidobacteriota bacterium]